MGIPVAQDSLAVDFPHTHTTLHLVVKLMSVDFVVLFFNKIDTHSFSDFGHLAIKSQHRNPSTIINQHHHGHDSEELESWRLKIRSSVERSRLQREEESDSTRIRHDTNDGPIGERVPQALIDNQQHTIKRQR